MRISVLVVAACLTITGLATADPARAAIRMTTNIEAQGLATALQALAKERDIQVVYRSELVGGRKTSGASGDLTVEEALTKILSGTGLTFQYLDEKGITIVPIAVGPKAGVSSRERTRLAQADTASASAIPAEDKLDEIIVTAQKREERLSDVPMSISAITANEIDQRGLFGAADYLRGIPGVNQVEDQRGQGIVIRGIETNLSGQNFFSGSAAATYFGETPTTNSAGLSGSAVDLKLVDIERVEVLRGPQGTAFGSSSLGGTVRTIPVAPDPEELTGHVAVGYSSTSGYGSDNSNVQAVGNVPLIRDRLALRATAYQYDDSGFYRNRAGSSASFQAAVAAQGAQAFAVNEEDVGAYHVAGGRIAALFNATENLKFTLSYLTQKNETNGWGLASSGRYEQTELQVAPEHVIRGQAGGLNDVDVDITSAMLEYDLGWADLLASYSYLDSGTVITTPTTTTGLNFAYSQIIDTDHRERVGELRLVTKFSGAWNFLAGLYAEDLDDDYFSDNLWHGDPAKNPFGVGQRLVGTSIQTRSLEQQAAFGEVSWQLLPRLTLATGVRIYEYDRDYQIDSTGPAFGASGIHLSRDTSSSGENFKASLSFKPYEGALLYAGASQGFRLGALQAGLPPGVCDADSNGIVDGTNISIESTREIKSDSVDSYELGGKFALLDRRVMLSASLFRMDWTDIPVSVQAGIFPGCGRLYIANAGEARSEGVELEAALRITDAIRVNVGGSWISAKLIKDAPAANAVAGDRLPGSPKANANLGVQYEFAMRGHSAFVRADSIYVGSFYADLAHTLDAETNDYVKIDASAGVKVGHVGVQLFVRNLTNEDEFTLRSINLGTLNDGRFSGYQMRPRTVGLQLAYEF